jgi:hypothetical protein
MLQGVSEGEKQRLMITLEEMQMKEQVGAQEKVHDLYTASLLVHVSNACARRCLRPHTCVR